MAKRKPAKPWTDDKPTEAGYYWLWIDWPARRPLMVRVKLAADPSPRVPVEKAKDVLVAFYPGSEAFNTVEHLWCPGHHYWAKAEPPPDTRTKKTADHVPDKSYLR